MPQSVSKVLQSVKPVTTAAVVAVATNPLVAMLKWYVLKAEGRYIILLVLLLLILGAILSSYLDQGPQGNR
jgi:predicted PurR-regulated permease PerM